MRNGNAMKFDFLHDGKITRVVTIAPHETVASLMKFQTVHVTGAEDWFALNEERAAALVKYLQEWLGERADLKKEKK